MANEFIKYYSRSVLFGEMQVKIKVKSKKGTTEDEIFGWHHRLNGREFE